jgi:hypothetical protein
MEFLADRVEIEGLEGLGVANVLPVRLDRAERSCRASGSFFSMTAKARV